MNQALWVEPIGGILVARVRGEPSFELLSQCQSRVLALLHETSIRTVLYDALEIEAPPLGVVWQQRQMDETLDVGFRRAILVPNTRIAYLARIAFAGDETSTKVFYNDLVAAVTWLRA
jgi:hypothetical protein